MRCRRSEELWSDYLEGTLPPPLRQELTTHLAECDDCRELAGDFREVVAALGNLRAPEPPGNLVAKILERTRPRLASLGEPRGHLVPFPIPAWRNAAVWAAAAVFAGFMIFRPPSFVGESGRRVSQVSHQVYSYGLRAYRASERLVDEINVLRMTVGVAFEDRLDRLNERLKDLEEARRRSGEEPDRSSRRFDTIVRSLDRYPHTQDDARRIS